MLDIFHLLLSLSTLLHPEKTKTWKRKAEELMREMWQKNRQKNRGKKIACAPTSEDEAVSEGTCVNLQKLRTGHTDRKPYNRIDPGFANKLQKPGNGFSPRASNGDAALLTPGFWPCETNQN